MAPETCTAWLIHRQPLRDTSLRLTLFTRENGLLSCVFRGARALKKKPVLHAFAPLFISLATSRGGYYINTMEEGGTPVRLQGEALFSAFYLNELIYYLLAQGEKEEALFAAYGQTLAALSESVARADVERALRRFEQVLLAVCGVAIAFDTDVENRPIALDNRYQFISEKGFVADGRGIPGVFLQAIHAGVLEDPDVLKTAKGILRAALDSLLAGRLLKSRDLFIKKEA